MWTAPARSAAFNLSVIGNSTGTLWWPLEAQSDKDWSSKPLKQGLCLVRSRGWWQAWPILLAFSATSLYAKDSAKPGNHQSSHHLLMWYAKVFGVSLQESITIMVSGREYDGHSSISSRSDYLSATASNSRHYRHRSIRGLPAPSPSSVEVHAPWSCLHACRVLAIWRVVVLPSMSLWRSIQTTCKV